MQVKEFATHVKDQLWPECQSQLDLCKTVHDAVIWRKRIIRAFEALKIAGEENVQDPQDN